MPISGSMSVASRTSAAPWRISARQPAASGFSGEPGTANTSRPCARACRAVISEPLPAAASTTTTPRARPEMMRLRCGKCAARGGVPGGNSETSAPRAAMRSDSAAVLRGIADVQSGAAYGDGTAAGRQRGLVRGRVDAARQTAGDDQPACAPGRRAIRAASARPAAVGWRLPTTAICAAAQQLDVAQREQQRRCVVQRSELAGISRLAAAKQLRAGRGEPAIDGRVLHVSAA